MCQIKRYHTSARHNWLQLRMMKTYNTFTEFSRPFGDSFCSQYFCLLNGVITGGTVLCIQHFSAIISMLYHLKRKTNRPLLYIKAMFEKSYFDIVLSLHWTKWLTAIYNTVSPELLLVHFRAFKWPFSISHEQTNVQFTQIRTILFSSLKWHISMK